MKHKTKTIAFLIGMFVLNLGFSQFISTSGSDEYWGGHPNVTGSTYQTDVIGLSNVFGLTSWNVRDDGANLRVSITGEYFKHIMLNSSSLLSTEMGDLFISTDGLSWTTGGAPTLNDYFGSGIETSWEYAVKLGEYKNNQGQLNTFNSNGVLPAFVYEVVDPNTQMELTNIPFNGVFRKDQEFRLANADKPVSSAAWFISSDYATLSIDIPDYRTVLGVSQVDPSTIGFHWTMSCGNDVTEFQFVSVPVDGPLVPEPSTLGIISGASLVMFLMVRRIRRKSN